MGNINITFHICVVYLFVMTCSSAQSVPAFFIFGDSAADVGNNNYVATAAKANTIPNGIDFGNPTGRFTNGRTVFDILQQQVGFKNFSPAYLAPTTVGDVILQGVNYAASASGIFNSTGSQYGETVSFDTQLKYHGRITLAIMSRIGVAATQKLLRKSIYAIALGANDILSKDSYTSKLTQDEFLDFVISRFRSQLQTLYNLAARKIMVNSVGLIGCSPFVKDIFFVAEGKCYDPFNQLAQMYNKKLKSLIVELNKDLDGAKFVYVDTYKTTEDIIQKFVSYGFVDATSACCSFFGRHGGLFGCSPFSKVCPDRSKYVFWDSFHLTDAANLVTAKYMMEGNLTYMFPMNVRQLVQS
ncbi:hypothetical protein ACFX13_022087 [Malus domestica]|uniref:GDSL esterase/lipase At4g16230-like isoform X1 n=1 Tax=Malus domestica TaxID=3750 RepID=UPI00049918CD|nr:GDSL esterase/lipase At4g16230-like [Malus domestica]